MEELALFFVGLVTTCCIVAIVGEAVAQWLGEWWGK
jgi:hypothetical protein